MHIALDLILVLIIVAIVLTSYRRGFVASVLSLASVIISSVAAWIFHAPLADYISSTFLAAPFTDAASEKIHSFSSGGDLDALFREMPSEFSSFLTNNQIDSSVVSDEYTSSGINGSEYVDVLAQRIGSALAYLASCAIALILIFAVASIVCGIISVFIKALFKLPILQTANKILGLVLGIAAALIFAWIFSHCAVTVLNAVSVLYPDTVQEGTVESTILVKLFSSINPFSLLIR